MSEVSDMSATHDCGELGPGSVIDSYVHVGLRGDTFGMGAFSEHFMAQPAFGAESKATTGAEHPVAHETQGMLGRLRLRTADAWAALPLPLAGEGRGEGAAIARSAPTKLPLPPGEGRGEGGEPPLAVGLEAMIAASAADPEAFKAAGIVDSDIALCRTLHDKLIAAEQEQAQAHITRKSLTRDRNATQMRLEDAVIAISLAGTLVFRTDPVIAAAFKDLVPKTPAKAKKSKPAPVGSRQARGPLNISSKGSASWCGVGAPAARRS